MHALPDSNSANRKRPHDDVVQVIAACELQVYGATLPPDELFAPGSRPLAPRSTNVAEAAPAPRGAKKGVSKEDAQRAGKLAAEVCAHWTFSVCLLTGAYL